MSKHKGPEEIWALSCWADASKACTSKCVVHVHGNAQQLVASIGRRCLWPLHKETQRSVSCGMEEDPHSSKSELICTPVGDLEFASLDAFSVCALEVCCFVF